MGQHTVKRYHDFCMGHRVVGHESKCRHLHGHNYRIHFHVRTLKPENGELDQLGRVVDFSVVKSTLAEWLEENWDHKFMAWSQDPIIEAMTGTPCIADLIHGGNGCEKDADDLLNSIVQVNFNPTAENIAEHFVEVVAPKLLIEHGIELIGVELEETRKCSVTYFK